MPRFHEISEAVAAAQKRRHQDRNDCLQFAKHQIDGLAKHIGWPHDLIHFAPPNVVTESHEWRPGFDDSIRMDDGLLTVGLRFETQHGHRIFTRMSVHQLDDVFVVTIAGVSKALPAAQSHAPDFWNAVSEALLVLAQSEA